MFSAILVPAASSPNLLYRVGINDQLGDITGSLVVGGSVVNFDYLKNRTDVKSTGNNVPPDEAFLCMLKKSFHWIPTKVWFRHRNVNIKRLMPVSVLE